MRISDWSSDVCSSDLSLSCRTSGTISRSNGASKPCSGKPSVRAIAPRGCAKTRSSKIMIGTKSRIMSEPRAVSKRLLQRCKPPAKSLPDLYQSQLNVEPRNYSMASPSSESNEVFQIMTSKGYLVGEEVKSALYWASRVATNEEGRVGKEG